MTDAAKTKSVIGRNEPKLNRKPQVSRLSEATVWQPVRDGWRRLYGGFDDLGVSIEWHDFELTSRFEWSRSFHPDSLELCLNLAGDGCIRCATRSIEFAPLTSGFYVCNGSELASLAKAGSTASLPYGRVFRSLPARPLVARAMARFTHWLKASSCMAGAQSGLGEVHRLTTEQERWIAQLPHPPTVQAARRLWYQSKVLELMAEFFFTRPGEDELFCDRQKRLARERVDRVVAILRQRLAEPPGTGRTGTGSRLQPVPSEPDIFAGNGSDDSAVSPQASHRARGRTAAERQIQRD